MGSHSVSLLWLFFTCLWRCLSILSRSLRSFCVTDVSQDSDESLHGLVRGALSANKLEWCSQSIMLRHRPDFGINEIYWPDAC